MIISKDRELSKAVKAKEVEMNNKLSEADTKSQKALLAKELEMQTKLRQANSSKMKAIEARDWTPMITSRPFVWPGILYLLMALLLSSPRH